MLNPGRRSWLKPGRKCSLRSSESSLSSRQLDVGADSRRQAYYESTGALSLISLVLAGNSAQPGISQQALSSVDPYIRETLPRGALGVDRLQAPQKSETDLHNVQMVELGWKTQSLESAAESLLNSATRLEKELEAETRYWDQVLKIKEQGWSVTRLPREKHALGVRFGFAEGVYLIQCIAFGFTDQPSSSCRLP